ncbi:hypothetical protein RB195_001327 [Necator americanus]|uniref:Uncharacterized protein n=1 Tax=Necator americanus TaxID=51031 RepID=A0ABR1DDR8_NECAM
MLDHLKAAAKITGDKMSVGAQKTKQIAKITGEKMKEGAQATKEATLDLHEGVKEMQAANDYEQSMSADFHGTCELCRLQSL